jgi:N-acetylglucosaminyldiphosphoundecaprenol N-acetyl-beta-D-mannosaminyltransferase
MATQNHLMPPVDILGIRTHAQTLDDAVTTLAQWSGDAQRRYVSTCPVYTLMLCSENERLRTAIQEADMVTADGMPVVWVQRWWGHKEAERVYGPDVMLELCQRTAGQGVSHFFMGGMAGVAEQLADTLCKRFPGLIVAGTHSPTVSEMTPDMALVEHLNAANANIIWVGLGSPKQDIWMHLHRPYLNAPLLIGVGAAFDFLSGSKAQAPVWMRRNGLEWLFRLASEPRRLWRRYFLYNPRFVMGVMRQYLSQHLE